MKKLYLVDVSSMYFRAFYAIRPLSNSKGLPTNALYGFLAMTVRLLREIRPEYMAFCFDHKKPSFRVDIDKRYKANREAMPEDLAAQVPYVRKIVDALGIPAYEYPGFEADDIIGSLTKYGRKHNLDVHIVSGDKDFGQLVTKFVSIFDPMKDVTLDEAGVTEKFGVRPDQVIDYLAIVGDSSDNVCGVKGIGPKGAQKLLNQYGTLDAIYENVSSIKPDGIAKKLKESKDEAYLSKRLVTIVTDMDLKADLDDLKLKPIDREALKALLQDLEFKNFERTLLGEGAAESASTKSGAASGNSAAASSAAMGAASSGGAAGDEGPVEVGDDFKSTEETVSVSKLSAVLPARAEVWALWTARGLALGYKNKAYNIEGDVDALATLLSDKKIQWKGYDLKEFWRGFRIRDPHATWDHMLAAYVVRSQPVEGFTHIYAQYVGEPFPELPSAAQWHVAHQKLEVALTKRLAEHNGTRVYRELEVPLIPILYKMERKGVLIDTGILKKESSALHNEIREIEAAIHEEVGETFNIGSPKQLGHILFDKLKLPAGKKTKTGYSTDSGVLEKLCDEFPICRKILEYRELTKLKSTYVDALPLLVSPDDGRLHTTFNQAVTTTGRLSSTNPNLQNIPIRTPRGSGIRRAFIANEGCELISADYSQIELRVLAHITDDPALKRAFADNLDIHTATASEIFGVKLKEVTPELRRAAKAVNFGIAYGMSAFGLAERLEMPRKQAQDIIQRYFTRFANVREYMTTIVETAKSQRYVETIFGRRRYIDELFSKNGQIRAFGERAAINAPIQGSASDIVKKAMIEVDKVAEFDLLLQVHDELIFEGSTKGTKAEITKVKRVMENVVELKVPLVVDAGSGPNWEAAH
ncbi:MAG TPA: DNA polymerase I [Bdellovibrionales bacterium]|nr:DNA polymerase I [Bdellovibrionales bacterium]